jgi:hypothetical protein
MLKKNANSPVIKSPVVNAVAIAMDKSKNGSVAIAPHVMNDRTRRK